jgi:hypothetical protein
MDIDKVQAISQFMGQVPPPMWGIMAPEAGFSPTAVMAMKNMAASMMAPPPGPGGPPNLSVVKGGKPDGPSGQGALPPK